MVCTNNQTALSLFNLRLLTLKFKNSFVVFDSNFYLLKKKTSELELYLQGLNNLKHRIQEGLSAEIECEDDACVAGLSKRHSL